MTYEFSEQEVANLFNFLNRTQIGGNESEAMYALRKKLTDGIPKAPFTALVPPVEPIQVED